MKPLLSQASSFGSQSVLGAAPIKMNRELAVPRLFAVGRLQRQAFQMIVCPTWR